MLFFVITPAFATEYYVVQNLDKLFTAAPSASSNAVCYFYKEGKFKCACKEPVNLKIWTSGDISRIKGFSQSRSYGNIEDCKDVDFQLGL